MSELIVSYGDQEHSMLYIRKENSPEYIYLEYDEAKELYMKLAKYVG